MSHTEHNNKNEQSSKNQNDQGPIIEPSNEPMLFGNPFQDDKSGKGSERPGSANGKKPRKNQRTNIVYLRLYSRNFLISYMQKKLMNFLPLSLCKQLSKAECKMPYIAQANIL